MKFCDWKTLHRKRPAMGLRQEACVDNMDISLVHHRNRSAIGFTCIAVWPRKADEQAPCGKCFEPTCQSAGCSHAECCDALLTVPETHNTAFSLKVPSNFCAPFYVLTESEGKVAFGHA